MSNECECKVCKRQKCFHRILNQYDFLDCDKEFLKKLMDDLSGNEFDNDWLRIEKEKFIMVYRAVRAIPNIFDELEKAMTSLGWVGLDERIRNEKNPNNQPSDVTTKGVQC